MAYWGGRRLYGAPCPGTDAAEIAGAAPGPDEAGQESWRKVAAPDPTVAERENG